MLSLKSQNRYPLKILIEPILERAVVFLPLSFCRWSTLHPRPLHWLPPTVELTVLLFKGATWLFHLCKANMYSKLACRQVKGNKAKYSCLFSSGTLDPCSQIHSGAFTGAGVGVAASTGFLKSSSANTKLY